MNDNHMQSACSECLPGSQETSGWLHVRPREEEEEDALRRSTLADGSSSDSRWSNKPKMMRPVTAVDA